MLKINKNNGYLFLSLLLGSFSDEAAQMIFALNLSNVEHIYITSLLLILGMVGGIIANTLFSQISQKLGIKKIIFICLMLESLLIVLSSFIYSQILYLFIAFSLGLLGGMLWSAVLIMVPLITQNEEELNTVNKYTHLIRNMGFMIGPIIGGFISSFSDHQTALFLVGLSTFLASLVMAKVSLHSPAQQQQYISKKAINGFHSIYYLLLERKIRYVLLPLIFTIISISTLSVLIIVYMIDIIKLDAEKYGLYSALFSLSLAVSPLILTKPISKLGEACGACISATFIGVGLCMLSITENYILMLCWGIFTAAFNGTQNTIMSAFMLKNIAIEHRENYMPAYGLILQISVFIGFLLSMFVSSQQIHTTFTLLGTLTVIAGLLGAYVNYRPATQN